MSAPAPRRLLFALVAATTVIAVALVVVALLAARSLRERDAAVRMGTLTRLAHQLEAELREGGPDAANATLTAFASARTGELAGAELIGPGGAVATSGSLAGDDVHEEKLLLGPSWRGVAGRGGRGFQGRGGPPYTLRLAPGPELGSASGLAGLLVLGSLAGAAAIIALAAGASRGLLQRERLAAAEAERERLASVALAGAGLAHRIRNPLAAIKGTAQLLASSGEGAQHGRAERIVEASERIELLISRLLEFARPTEPQREALDLTELARSVASRGPGMVRVEGGSAIVVDADREHVESILEELLANARAFDPVGELEVTVRREGAVAVVSVADRGPGPGSEPERAFEPYVTSRPDGTGLGLAIVRGLARANGGDARLRARMGGGAEAELRLPVREG